jgi:hypothetical protein
MVTRRAKFNGRGRTGHGESDAPCTAEIKPGG